MTTRKRIKRAIHVIKYSTPVSLSPSEYSGTIARGLRIIRDNWHHRESVAIVNNVD
jgi:hypothetical protein